jgi:predicted DNA binding protein
MTVVDARIRVHHPCPYCDISAEFPEVLILLWCDNRRDLFLLSASDPAALRSILGAVKDAFHARPLLTDGTDALVTLPDFEWTDPPSVTGLARRAGVWVLHPVVYYGGTETYRLLAPSRPKVQRFIERVRRVGAVEVLSVTERGSLRTIRDLPSAAVHFFEGLTAPQARSLVAAYEGGLLDVPARSRWEEVARRVGVSRSTFGEHLRKGQLRLLANSYAALRSRAVAAEPSVLLSAMEDPRQVHRTPLRGTRGSGSE